LNKILKHNFRQLVAIAVAKFALALLGPNSSSAPGLAALKFSPNLLQNLLKSIPEAPIYVTGTNGKSTTAGFLASILSEANLQIVHNKSGANLLSGLATALIKKTNFNTMQVQAQRALLETDEAVIRKVTNFAPGQSILVTNFFRDQLDRFGEMEHTIKLVQEGLNFVEGGILITNADDPNTCHLKADNILYYGIDAEAWNGGSIPQVFAEELANCPNCDADLKYKKQWLGQLGDFYCGKCEYQKPQASIKVTNLVLGADGSQACISFPDGQLEVQIPLPGLFNVYNALAAISVAYNLKIPFETIKVGVQNYQPLFGRSQAVKYKGRELKLFLIKNPIGASEVLRLIQTDLQAKVLITINDNYADGRDVSWLWDAYFEYLANINKPVFVTGKRGSDMAVRLKYAGLKQITYYANLKNALDEFVEGAKADEHLYVLPTYTALLQITRLVGLKKD
jgi:lipid II isoglutaminyl synthase (glutamine-hydrolysing)